MPHSPLFSILAKKTKNNDDFPLNKRLFAWFLLFLRLIKLHLYNDLLKFINFQLTVFRYFLIKTSHFSYAPLNFINSYGA